MIASQELSARLIGPSWGLNQRKYYRNFRTSRLDFIIEDALVRLPHFSFTEQDYLDSGETDFGDAIKLWAKQHGLLQRKSFAITVDGLYGGYAAIWNARAMITSKLLSSKDTIKNIYEISSKLDRSKLFVTIHVRSTVGGHQILATDESPRGRFNICLPADWYMEVCETLRNHFGDRIQFHIFTDRGGPEFEEMVRRFNPNQTRQGGLTECSDLMLMAQSDLRVCSVSSYSLIASFLSDGPYLWYEPQLELSDGAYTLWGNEPAQQSFGSLTMRSREAIRALPPESDCASLFRGYPATASGHFSSGLLKQLEGKLTERSTGNLLNYGAVPEWLK
jgi:hypothetical protein